MNRLQQHLRQLSGRQQNQFIDLKKICKKRAVLINLSAGASKKPN